MADVTVIYYTANHERWEFERRIIETLLAESAGLPLITVSQKPMEIGRNICVGVRGTNSLNTWRQVLIGCRAATTKFVCLAESDTLHPACYFNFEPERDDTLYIFKPLYIVFAKKGISHAFYKKSHCDNHLMVGRELLIKRLDSMLCGLPEWQAESDYEKNPFQNTRAVLSDGNNSEFIYMDIPTVTFKTEQGMHRKSPYHRGAIHELPYWGTSVKLMEKYFV